MGKSWIDHNACFEWYSELEKENLVLSFKGEFNHDLVKAILVLTQQHRVDSEGPSRIFGVIVECLQNICKHGAPISTENNLRSGIILMGKQKGEYIVGVGNFVANGKVSSLKAKYNKVNEMDEEGLRQMQHEILVNSSLTDEGNAGIGIIYMARKTEGEMKYRLQQIDDKLSFFSLQLRVKV
ncbi:MAG: SiaB family protein kinase [Flavobacteriales bacterium]|nr:SiaB family protein kinase [Flavobacteriales bacterium]